MRLAVSLEKRGKGRIYGAVMYVRVWIWRAKETILRCMYVFARSVSFISSLVWFTRMKDEENGARIKMRDEWLRKMAMGKGREEGRGIGGTRKREKQRE